MLNLQTPDKNEIHKTIQSLSVKDKIELLELLERRGQTKARTDFLSFVREMWPDFISGRHHAKMARAFEDVAAG